MIQMLLQQMLQRRCAPPAAQAAAQVPLVPVEAAAVHRMVPQLPPQSKLPPLVPVP